MAKRQKSAFGQYLVDQIKTAGMSQEAFYTKVGIAKPYFYDLLKSAPPAEMQRKMVDVLEAQTGPDVDRQRKLFDLAAQEREEIPVDICELLTADVTTWNVIRTKLGMIPNVD